MIQVSASFQEAIDKIKTINTSSMDSIRETIVCIDTVFNEVESIYGDPPSFIMDMFGDEYPEIVVLALFRSQNTNDIMSTLFNYCDFIDINHKVFNLLKSITFSMMNGWVYRDIGFDVKDLYTGFLCYVKFENIDMESIVDDVVEIFVNFCRQNQVSMSVRDRMITFMNKYANDLSDGSYPIFKDLSKELLEIDPAIGRFLLLFLTAHTYLNHFILLIKENQNKIVMRYIYKYKILEGFKNE